MQLEVYFHGKGVKMYDLSGLYYQLKTDALVFSVVGLLFLVCSRFWILDKRNIKELLIGVICYFLSICSIGYHLYVINDLKVSINEGVFIEEHRENPYLFRMEYCFSNEGGLKPLFYLDIFSKKDIYPTEFEKDAMYRIYYEEKTDVIVKVEKLE